MSSGTYLCPTSRTDNSSFLSLQALPKRRQLGTHLLPMIEDNYQVRLFFTKNPVSLAHPNTASTKSLSFSHFSFLSAMQINTIYNNIQITPLHFTCFVCSPWSEYSHPYAKAVTTINASSQLSGEWGTSPHKQAGIWIPFMNMGFPFKVTKCFQHLMATAAQVPFVLSTPGTQSSMHYQLFPLFFTPHYQSVQIRCTASAS